ncbi:hypothetical protein XELAEV_18043195mg [Xenopus laevis]|uniref:Uncharacterized protein n=1 Tax=Xenopus laevis TaxID=8355 RepID=A0A974BWL5_XENLA|nr:hypothetical protein XELAEV_18043195mg [Xenopus laevis]
MALQLPTSENPQAGKREEGLAAFSHQPPNYRVSLHLPVVLNPVQFLVLNCPKEKSLLYLLKTSTYQVGFSPYSCL